MILKTKHFKILKRNTLLVIITAKNMKTQNIKSKKSVNNIYHNLSLEQLDWRPFVSFELLDYGLGLHLLLDGLQPLRRLHRFHGFVANHESLKIFDFNDNKFIIGSLFNPDFSLKTISACHLKSSDE